MPLYTYISSYRGFLHSEQGRFSNFKGFASGALGKIPDGALPGLTHALRKEMIEKVPKGLPTMLSYKTHAEKDSLYNTPPTWPIWISLLCCHWLERQGGLAGIAKRNEEKARLLYDALDGDDFYRPTAAKDSRSQMNVTFRLADEAQEERFAKEASARGLVGLKGHRAVGGLRASIYNAMPVEGVQALVAFLREFRRG